MFRAWWRILGFELTRVLRDPFFVGIQAVVTAGIVALRHKNKQDLPIFTACELLFYCGLIFFTASIDTTHSFRRGGSYTDLLKERGVFRSASSARMVLYSALPLIGCTIGIVNSAFVSPAGGWFWLGIWLAVFGIAVFQSALNPIIELIQTTSVGRANVVFFSVFLGMVSGFVLFICIGVLLSFWSTSTNTGAAWVGAAYAVIGAAIAQSLVVVVAGRVPRREPAPLPGEFGTCQELSSI